MNKLIIDTQLKEVRYQVTFEPDNRLIYEYLSEVWTQHANNKAFVEDDEAATKITFGELYTKVLNLAGKFQAIGVTEDTLVCCTGPTTLKMAVTLLALVFTKCRILLAKSYLTPYELSQLLLNLPITYAIVDSKNYNKFIEIKNNLPELKKIINFEDDEGLHSVNGQYRTPARSDPKTTVCHMTFTSGSTGPSKAVMITHYNVAACCTLPGDNDLAQEMNILPQPLSHVSGIISLFVYMFKARTVMLVDPSIVPMPRILFLFHQHKVPTSLAMAVLFQKLLNEPEKFQKCYEHVKVMMHGGSKISDGHIIKFRQLYPWIQLKEFYALSEVPTFVGITNPLETHQTGLNILPNIKIRIRSTETGELLNAGGVGEIEIGGPIVSIGYLNNEAATRSSFEDGWFKTGDVGYYDSAGKLFISDRIKEMIKCLGSQLAPSEIEILVTTHPQVKNVLVIGTESDQYGEAPTAFVIPEDGCGDLKNIAEEIFDKVRSQLSHHKQLYGGITFVRSIPSTDNGKFSRKLLLEGHRKSTLDILACFPHPSE